LEQNKTGEDFKRDLEIAKKMYKAMRIKEIRGEKHSKVGLLGDNSPEGE
jgi:hypothetical protein